MKPNTVALTIVAITLTIVAWDVYLYMDSIDRNSISQVIIDATEATALVPWVIGLLMGGLAVHWFEARPVKEKHQRDKQELMLYRTALLAITRKKGREYDREAC